MANCGSADAETLKKSLKLRNSELVSLKKNLVDSIWAQDRPIRPKNKIFPLDTKYSGESSQDKIRRLREELTTKKVKGMVINMLDEIAWLFNLRGADIDFNPGRYSEFAGDYYSNFTIQISVFFSYTIITLDSVTLFVDPAQVDDIVRKHIDPGVDIQSYDSFFPYLKKLRDRLGSKDDAVRLCAYSIHSGHLCMCTASSSCRYSQPCSCRSHWPGVFPCLCNSGSLSPAK